MAIIKITPALKDEVYRKAAEPYDAQLKALLTITNPRDVDAIYKYFVPESTEQVLKSLHKSWFDKYGDSMYVSIRPTSERDSDQLFWLKLNYKRRPTVYGWSNGGNHPDRTGSWRAPPPIRVEKNTYGEWRTLPVQDLLALNLSVDYMAEATRLISERETLLDGLTKVLNSVPTVNSALKVWPALEAYLNDERKETLGKVVEKKKSADKIAQELDLDKLNVAHITQRITGAV